MEDIMIKLTHIDGYPVYINPKYIVAVEPSERRREATAIWTVEGGYDVQESVKVVLARIKNKVSE